MLTFSEWYRILRQHNHFSIWESLTFARWLAGHTRVAHVPVSHGYVVARVIGAAYQWVLLGFAVLGAGYILAELLFHWGR